MEVVLWFLRYSRLGFIYLSLLKNHLGSKLMIHKFSVHMLFFQKMGHLRLNHQLPKSPWGIEQVQTMWLQQTRAIMVQYQQPQNHPPRGVFTGQQQGVQQPPRSRKPGHWETLHEQMNHLVEPACVNVLHLKILRKCLGRAWNTLTFLQSGISAHRKINHI